uniref:Succinate dehydrogenase cytochrome b560 subunit, mitochondrial n=1 Tax=Acrobeloides nanus TaxID=290746 RepID=A0A914EAQ0_9BILA
MLSCYRLCGSLKKGSFIARSVRTSAIHGQAKTPIQEWGWKYLVRQEASGRPLSPHLSIYKPQITWFVSGAHRITGCVMAGVLLFGGIGFAALPIDFTTFIDAIQSLGLPRFVLGTFKLIIAYPIVFHTLNGIRFIGYDLAKGMDLPTIHKTGWLVVGLSLIISLAIVLNSKREPVPKANK